MWNYNVAKSKWAITGILLTVAMGPAAAQDSPAAGDPSGASETTLQSLKTQLEDLEQKIRILERNKELESEQAAEKAKSTPIASLGAGGLTISSADSNFVMRIRGYAQVDARAFLGDHEDLKGNDTFLLRRVRPIFEGTVARDFEYRVMLDFSSGVTSAGGNNGFLQDAYVNFKKYPAAQLQIGKFKEPVGLERLQSGANLLFVERGLPTYLVPNRDVGIMLHGKLWENTLSYQLGYFNGVEDGGSGDLESGDDGKDLAGRIFVHPFDLRDVGALKKLGLGVAVTHGQHEGALRNYGTAGQQTWYRWRTGAGTSGSTANVTSDDNTTRVVPQGYYYYGPFGVLGEYVISSRDAVSTAGTGSRRERLRSEAWQVAGSVFLTGEENQYGTVTPKRPFGLSKDNKRGWGALELVARVGQLSVDDEAFSDGDGDGRSDFATDNSAEGATEWGVGLNWHLNRNVKASLNYVHSDFDLGDLRSSTRDLTTRAVTSDNEDVIFARVQFSF